MLKKILFLGVLLLAFVPSAHACPSCNAAVQETSGAEDEDRLREGQAYNSNILLMVAMPYLLLGSVGFLIYRGTRLNALARPDMVKATAHLESETQSAS